MRYRLLVVPMLGVLLFAGSAPAWAQVTLIPDTVRLTLRQGETAEASLRLLNGGSEALRYCLDFADPLQVRGPEAEAPEFGHDCGAPGSERLRAVFTSGPTAHYTAAAPDGRLYAPDVNSTRVRVLTAELEEEEQILLQMDHSLQLRGLAYDSGGTNEAPTLWWAEVEQEFGGGVYEILSIALGEATLDGAATGRHVEVPVPPPPPDFPDAKTGGLTGLALDEHAGVFYFIDPAGVDLWAVDTLGVPLAGYPRQLTSYDDGTPGGLVTGDLDGHGSAAGFRLEVPLAPLTSPTEDRVVLADRLGRDLLARDSSGIEAPLPNPDDDGHLGVARSRIWPNGALYLGYLNFVEMGMRALRPHPLTPPWLVPWPLADWQGVLAPGEEAVVPLSFRASEPWGGEEAAPPLPAGVYRDRLLVRDTTGAVLGEVALVLEVASGTVDAEEEPGVPAVTALGAPYPNPSRGGVTIPLALAAASEVRVAVYDVLGRRIAVLAEGTMEAGAHRLHLGGSALPSGVYVVRAVAGGEVLTQRVTVVDRGDVSSASSL